MVASGLDDRLEVTYKGENSNRAVQGEVLIETEDSQLTIPITALPPSSRIVPDSRIVNLGKVGVNTVSKFQITLTNIGILDGTFKLQCDNDAVQIMLTSGQLVASKVCEILGVCKPTKIGVLDAHAVIQTAPASEQCASVSVVATVVQSSLALLLDGREITDVDFGTVFLGQRRVLEMELVNRGMYKNSYIVIRPQDEPVAEYSVPIFAALPAEGLINAYGSSALCLVFTPREEVLERRVHRDNFAGCPPGPRVAFPDKSRIPGRKRAALHVPEVVNTRLVPKVETGELRDACRTRRR
jgi:hypothetical protein